MEGRVESIAADPNSHTLAIGGHGTITLLIGGRAWKRRELLPRNWDGEGVHGLDFREQGTEIVVATRGSAQVWDVGNRERIAYFSQHTDCLAASISPDGYRAVTIAVDGLMRIWALPDRLVRRVSDEACGDLLSVAADKTRFCLTGSRVDPLRAPRSVQVYETSSARPVAPPIRTAGPIVAAAFSPRDAGELITASCISTSPLSGCLEFWRYAEGVRARDPVTFRRRPLDLLCVRTNDTTYVVCADGALLAVHSNGLVTGTLLPGRPALNWGYQPARWFVPFRNGGPVAVIGFDPWVTIFNSEDGKTIQRVRTSGRTRCGTFLEDANRLALGCDNRLIIADLRERGGTAITNTHSAWIGDMDFDPQRRHLVTASLDHVVRLFETRTPIRQIMSGTCDEEVWTARVLRRTGHIGVFTRSRWARMLDPVFALPLQPPVQQIGATGAEIVEGMNISRMIVPNSRGFLWVTVQDDPDAADAELRDLSLVPMAELLSNERVSNHGLVNMSRTECLDSWREHGELLRSYAARIDSLRIRPGGAPNRLSEASDSGPRVSDTNSATLLSDTPLPAPVDTALFPSVIEQVRDEVAGGRILVVHYQRPAQDYADWDLWTWLEGEEGSNSTFSGADDFGRYAVVPLGEEAQRVGFIVRRGSWQEKDVDQDRFVACAAEGATEIWVQQGVERFHIQQEDDARGQTSPRAGD